MLPTSCCVSAYTGVADAFAAACACIAAAVHPDSGVQALAAARESFAKLRLDGGEITSLLQLPWSNTEVLTPVKHCTSQQQSLLCPGSAFDSMPCGSPNHC